MSSLKMIKDYKENDAYRKSFNVLSMETFGLDFEPFYKKGFWNDHYICYSMLDGNRVVANISMNKLSIIMDGKEYKVIQIGTVMTHPDYRRQGLGRQLMEAIYADYDDSYDFYYIFGNDYAYDFYVKLGFEPVAEHTFTMEYHYEPEEVGSMRQLSIDKPEDEALIKRLVKNKTSISNDFAIKDEQHLLLFYMLYVYTDDVYYIEDKDAIVICEIEDGVLSMVDVLCEEAIPVDVLLPYIATEEVKQVAFQFTPNIDTTHMSVEVLDAEDSTTMFRGARQIPKKPFRFSECSHA